jgi:hypothetical protein
LQCCDVVSSVASRTPTEKVVEHKIRRLAGYKMLDSSAAILKHENWNVMAAIFVRKLLCLEKKKAT